MAEQDEPRTPQHGAALLPGLRIDGCNALLRVPEGFLGDRASSGAFQAIVDDWRQKIGEVDDDPLGGAATEDIPREQLDRLLTDGDPEAAGLVHGAIEDYAHQLAEVVRGLLTLPEWQGTERIVVGGGMRGSRVGELAIGRTTVLLKAEGTVLTLVPIRQDPDAAGLIGGLHLAPRRLLDGREAALAVDIGGTKLRAGLVDTNLSQAGDLAKAAVRHAILWQHADQTPNRDEAIRHLIGMLRELIARAEREGVALAPFIGIGCPGCIEADGTIAQGAQNLPGDWESGFNLPDCLAEAMPRIGDAATTIVMHNDAVVQGLSQRPFMQDIARWGVLTIGTGLGNARFTNLDRVAD